MSDFDGLGVTPNAADSSNLLGLESVIQKTALFIVEDLEEWLIKEGISSTGSQKFGIAPEPMQKSDGSISFKIFGDKYYDYVDEGVNGIEVSRGSQYSFKSIRPSKKMANSLKPWIAAKGIPLIGDIDTTSYIYAASIKKKGIEKRNISERYFDASFMDKIAAIFEQALDIAVDRYFEKLKDELNN